MKKLLSILLIIQISLSISAQTAETEINWMTFNDALKAQKEHPKKIMMDVYTNWCGPCKLMDEKTFKNPDVINYINTHFYPVKFNGEGPGKIKYDGQVFKNTSYDPKKIYSKNSAHQLTDYLQIQGFPSILFFEEDSGLLVALPGYRTAKQLEFHLKLFGSNAYKKINTQADYQKYQDEFEYIFE
ncbi:MAG: thioredoxin family protein [Flavobacteriaceae bacterium]